MAEVDPAVLKAHVVSDEQPVALLDVSKAFEKLTEQEKKYAHYLSLASWHGSLICLEQTSIESPLIFGLFQRLFSCQSLESLRHSALASVTDVDFRRFVLYAAAFYGNMGNYLSFGDTKIVPAVAAPQFRAIVAASSAQGALRSELLALCDQVLPAIYSLDASVRELGFPDRPAVSTYYSPDVTRAQIDLVNEFMAARNISPYNTRLFVSKGDDEKEVLELRIAAGRTTNAESTSEFKGHSIRVVYGDYDHRLADVAHFIEQALPFAANDNQRDMLQSYVRHFREGPIEHHKQAQRAWIRDIGPTVECNIGFIESYRDPAGVRGEFEGFVAVVNKETSRKFNQLVEAAPTYLALLPWPKHFEKDTFLRPDFTSLEVITFASSGVPAGINIPNYDDIRQNEGFKNVSLGNVLSAKGGADEKFSFLSDADQHMYGELKTEAFEVQVGCHELLGHGSGKLFVADADGKLNAGSGVADSITNPLTNEQGIRTWYKPGQTYDSVFGAMGSSFEECRAECVGIYLSANLELLKVFGFEGQQALDIMYINWLNMARAGVLGLEFFSPESGNWRQAHMQARFAILRTLLEASRAHHAAHPDQKPFLEIEYSADGSDAIIHLNRDAIVSVGVPAIAKFLLSIQVYKSTADFAGAHRMYIEERTKVDGEFLALRTLVMEKKRPRRVFVQVNTFLNHDGSVALKEYEPSAEGLIASFVDRFAPFGRSLSNSLPLPLHH